MDKQNSLFNQEQSQDRKDEERLSSILSFLSNGVDYEEDNSNDYEDNDPNTDSDPNVKESAGKEDCSVFNPKSKFHFSSLKDAHQELKRTVLLGPDTHGRRKEIVDYITEASNEVFSECEIYHNFVMDLFRMQEYVLGERVCRFALSRAPYHRDMLADAIQACGKSSQFDLGEEYLAKAEEIPKDKWSFRLFLYSTEFLKFKYQSDPRNEDALNRGLKIAEKYMEVFPFDEHGYNQQAELLIVANRHQEAEEKLRKYILEPIPGHKSSLITAQCCVTLLNLLDDSDKYDVIIEVCEKGIINTTQEQPSARMGFFLYRMALAYDASGLKDNYREDTLQKAMECYQSAYDLLDDNDYIKTVEQRVAILRRYVKDFKPMKKNRSVYVEES